MTNRTHFCVCSVMPIRLYVGMVALCMITSITTPLVADELDHDRETMLPEQWSFQLDRDEVGQDQRWFDPDVARGLSWQKIQVTAPWGDQLMSDEPADAATPDSHGVAWYWTPFQSPEFGEGERLWLEVGAIKGSARVYINGEALATPKGDPQEPAAPADPDQAADSEKPRRYDITSQVQPGENHVMIQVASRSGAGGITKPALLRRTATNWVRNPGFTDGLEAWRLYINENEQPIEPAFAPGLYHGERSVRVEVEPAQLVVLDQHTDQIMTKGNAYRISVRYRQQLDEPANDVTPLRLMWMTYPKRAPRQPHDKLWVHGATESTEGWEELTGIFEAQENYTGFRVGTFINAAGVYHVDEVTVSPVTATDESKN